MARKNVSRQGADYRIITTLPRALARIIEDRHRRYTPRLCMGQECSSRAHRVHPSDGDDHFLAAVFGPAQVSRSGSWSIKNYPTRQCWGSRKVSQTPCKIELATTVPPSTTVSPSVMAVTTMTAPVPEAKVEYQRRPQIYRRRGVDGWPISVRLIRCGGWIRRSVIRRPVGHRNTS